jgi:hypothetical protein
LVVHGILIFWENHIVRLELVFFFFGNGEINLNLLCSR